MRKKSKSTQTAIAVGVSAAAVILVLLLFFLLGKKQTEHEKIVLPDAASSSEQTQAETGGSTAQLLAVTKDNVQQVVASLTRPAAYHQMLTVTSINGEKSAEQQAELWVSGKLVRGNLTNGERTRSFLTDGQTLYVWYDGDKTAFQTTLDDAISTDDLTGIPTYEAILQLAPEAITAGSFLGSEETGENCIYVEATEENTETVYWLSTDSGLLWKQETTENGSLVYRAEQTALELYAEGDAALKDCFKLPNGTAPFSMTE